MMAQIHPCFLFEQPQSHSFIQMSTLAKCKAPMNLLLSPDFSNLKRSELCGKVAISYNSGWQKASISDLISGKNDVEIWNIQHASKEYLCSSWKWSKCGGGYKDIFLLPGAVNANHPFTYICIHVKQRTGASGKLVGHLLRLINETELLPWVLLYKR